MADLEREKVLDAFDKAMAPLTYEMPVCGRTLSVIAAMRAKFEAALPADDGGLVAPIEEIVRIKKAQAAEAKGNAFDAMLAVTQRYRDRIAALEGALEGKPDCGSCGPEFRCHVMEADRDHYRQRAEKAEGERAEAKRAWAETADRLVEAQAQRDRVQEKADYWRKRWEGERAHLTGGSAFASGPRADPEQWGSYGLADLDEAPDADEHAELIAEVRKLQKVGRELDELTAKALKAQAKAKDAPKPDEPIKWEEWWCDHSCKAMRNRPPLTKEKQSDYLSIGLYHLADRWVLSSTLQSPGGCPTSHAFVVTHCPFCEEHLP